MDDKYITKTQLKERGWTESIIKKMKLVHDDEKRNPMFKSASPMKLYLIAKVEKIEKTLEFKDLIERSLKRKDGAKKAVETKTKKLLEYADNVEIVIEYIEEPLLTDLAIRAYNSWNVDRDVYASRNSDKEFLNRIRNNFIRHELTNYDGILVGIKAKVGKSKAYEIIRSRVEERIWDEWNKRA